MEQSQHADPPAQAPPQETHPASPLAPNSALSASAVPFSPAPPPPDVSSNDYFAQTGASQDELFDGITPLAGGERMRVRSEDDLFSEDFQPAAKPAPVVQDETQGTPPRRSRGDGGARGGRTPRGARSRGGGRAKNAAPPARPVESGEEAVGVPENAPKGPRSKEKESITTTPSTAAVKGDRQATGGISKPKLTEDQLAQKMEAIRLKNADLTAAHARAEADKESFAQREQQARQLSEKKQKEERRDRQQMMGERERNRMRKLKAMEGREWDAEKNEDDFSRGGRFDKKGTFAGDREDYTDGREYLYRESRGGGERNRGRGRGGGRGGKDSQPAPPSRGEADFPALPPVANQNATSESAHDAVRSWADQVESSHA